MKVTVILKIKPRKAEAMRFARLMEVSSVVAAGDLLTVGIGCDVGLITSYVIDGTSPENKPGHRENYGTLRVKEREFFEAPVAPFGDCVLYVKPTKAFEDLLDRKTREPLSKTVEMRISELMAMAGFMPLAMLYDMATSLKKYPTKLIQGRAAEDYLKRSPATEDDGDDDR